MPEPAPFTRDEVSLDMAQALLAAVRAEAERMDLTVAAFVVDLGGQLVAAMRMDGTQLISLTLAPDKAYTAVAARRPTDAWAASTQPGGEDWALSTTLGGRFIAFAGGLPLYRGTTLLGGLGVSGAPAADDRHCAEVALRAVGLTAEPG